MDSVLLKRGFLLGSLLVGVLAVSPVSGQEPLHAADAEKLEKILATPRSPDLLHCTFEPQPPLFDFAFRFEVGFIVTCSLARFGGHASEVLVHARVTPEGGKPALLGETYRLPEITWATKHGDLNQKMEMSGGFAVGEGRYQIEVVVADRATGRTSRKHWQVRVARRGNQKAADVAVPPGSVVPLEIRPWPIKMDTSGKGLRVTVLLDAAPMNPRSPALRAWDRAFLLGSLSSLLNQIPCASVRLRAFNLPQEREVFRQDQFDDAGFVRLGESLRTLELGTISTRVLQKRRGGLDMLGAYAKEELTAADPSDAVIFLGPQGYFADVPRGLIPARETANPHFYYFEHFTYFFPDAQLPDAIATFTKHLNGTIYLIFSPGDLASSIQKMLARQPPRSGSPSDSRWAARPAPAH